MRHRRQYKRSKTVPAWKHSAAVVMLSTLCVGVTVGLLQEKYKPVMASPLSNKEYVMVEKIVEKEIPVTKDSPIEDQIRAAFGAEGDIAVKVARCESHLNPKAVNKSSSARGLFQIMQSWHKIDQKWLFDPVINIQVAHKLYQEQGWTPWAASNHCHGAL